MLSIFILLSYLLVSALDIILFRHIYDQLKTFATLLTQSLV